MNNKVKILVTGAHFTPAVAVIEELKKNFRADIVYVGRKTTLEGDTSPSIESQILPNLGIKFIPIITGRLQRILTRYTFPALFKIPIGLLQSLYIILSEKPDVILSFGGYVSVPIVCAGWLFSIPIVVHEQTLVTSLANKINSLFADKIALTFEREIKDRRAIITGNPIREQILNPSKIISIDFIRLFKYAKKRGLPVILIMGGNQGSHIINISVEGVLDRLTKIACVIHVTGDNKFSDFGRLEKLQNDCYLVKKWVGDEIGTILSKVDLVVSRAGINTLMELAYSNKPALVIPIPYLYQDEQHKNARYFEQLGLVQILPQGKLSGESLLAGIKTILNEKKTADFGGRKFIKDAAKRLALETILLAYNK